MCLIIKKPANIQISAEFFQNVYILNNDGWGVMYSTGFSVETYKGFDLKELVELATSLKNKNLYIHMRKATVGDVSYANTHPFPLCNGAMLMHNGTIGHLDTEKGESDSSALVRVLNNLIEKFGEDILVDSVFNKVLEKFIDSRLLILFPDGRELIVTDYPWFTYEKENLVVSNTYAWDLWKPPAPVKLLPPVPSPPPAVSLAPNYQPLVKKSSNSTPSINSFTDLFTGSFYQPDTEEF